MLPGECIHRDISKADPHNHAIDPTAIDLIRNDLLQQFGVECVFVDGESGAVVSMVATPAAIDWMACGEMCRRVAQAEMSEIVVELGDYAALAIPVPLEPRTVVAVAVLRIFVSNGEPQPDADEAVCGAAELARCEGSDPSARIPFGETSTDSPLPVGTTARHRARVWDPVVARRLGDLYVANTTLRLSTAKTRFENRMLSEQLAATREKITLVRKLTSNLKLTRDDEELGSLALEWLAETIPASSLAILLTPVVDGGLATIKSRSTSTIVTRGVPLLDLGDFESLVERCAADTQNGPIVLNHAATSATDWPLPRIREVVLAPISEGEHLFGWIAALNHRRGHDFGEVEADLIGCVASILGIHSCNSELYRAQSEVMANVVKALASAIDAKDPYTRGHSDRVARVSVCLAKEMGLDTQTINTIYLSGLLHDVGKIGINDQVLRKPGRLTEEEYEHIKTHAEIGYRILAEIKQIDEVLPVVLHHHEQWNGEGYPRRLRGEEIPLLARIVAVADSFDAMTSDRPYRPGMPDENVDAIMRSGAGGQWDANVVEAFFRARNEIREIVTQTHRDQTVDAV